MRGRRILIDPGHGGGFTGAEGAERTREADVNLGVALYLWGLLHDAGAEAQLTRASDRDFLPPGSNMLRDDLAARVALVDSLRPEVFLSLHHNSNAELDRERNAIETYYRLDDEGPSYDLARDIHRRLAQKLGIGAARLLPGNYFVLRQASTAAVLGEASYLSNPHVESKLQLAEKQQLEAEAYFLGLVDYFAKGVPQITKLVPATDTLRTSGTLRWRIEPGGDSAIDPLAVTLRVDGEPQACGYDAARSEAVWVAGAELRAGRREIELRVRNLRGNAAVWRDTVTVHAPPVRALVVQEPDPAAPGSDVRVRIRLLDAWNRGVADGLPVQVEPRRCTVLQRETRTRDGDLLVLARLQTGGRASLIISADTVTARLALRSAPRAAVKRLLRCTDRVSGAAVDAVRLRCVDGSEAYGDRFGCALVDRDCDTLQIDRGGYVRWRGGFPPTGAVALAPVHGGHLHGRVFVLDPGGSGRDPSAPGLGVSGSQIAHDISRRLATFLDGAGARAHLTRGPAEAVPELERVRMAAHSRADWYVRIEAGLEAGSPAAVLHYPGSAAGERLAASLARWLGRRSGRTVQVRADTRTILQQTPCPAVVVQLPVPPSVLQQSPGTPPDSLHHAAYALFVGIRAGVAPEIETWPTLAVATEPTAALAGLVLDGAETVPLGTGGRFVCECVEPGEHWLTLVLPTTILERRVVVTPTDTTHVRLAEPPRPAPPGG